MHDICSQDVQDFKDLFAKQAGDLGDTGKNIQKRIESIGNKINSFTFPGDNTAIRTPNNFVRNQRSRSASSRSSTQQSARSSSFSNLTSNFLQGIICLLILNDQSSLQ